MDACQLAMAVRQAMRAPGDLAEVAVFQGGSAKIICENRTPGRALHLFDTFAGLPEVSPIDATHFSVGDWTAPLEHAQAYLSAYEDVHFYPGGFPDTAHAVERVQFAFAGILVSDHYRCRPVGAEPSTHTLTTTGRNRSSSSPAHKHWS